MTFVSQTNIEIVGDRYKKWIENFVDMSNLGDDASYPRIFYSNIVRIKTSIYREHTINRGFFINGLTHKSHFSAT